MCKEKVHSHPKPIFLQSPSVRMLKNCLIAATLRSFIEGSHFIAIEKKNMYIYIDKKED